VHVRGQGTGVGAVAGGVAGAVLGNQIGNGNGRTAMTLLGAGGGAYLGNEIEKNTRAATRYTVTVRMNDGSYRTLQRSTLPNVSVGQKVRVDGNALYPASLS
jgi:outer membrane lipoprotein SlyB